MIRLRPVNDLLDVILYSRECWKPIDFDLKFVFGALKDKSLVFFCIFLVANLNAQFSDFMSHKLTSELIRSRPESGY